MTKQEFSLFAAALRTYYPKEKILPNEQAMQLWYTQLQDLDYKLAVLVLNKWVATNKWSPSIADIREQAAEANKGQSKDWGEAWHDVLLSIGKYGSYQEQAALESFDELTRQAVKRLGYRNICLSEDINVDRANFRMIYEQLEQRQKQDAQIPSKLKEMLEQVSKPLIGGSNEALYLDKNN